MPISNKELLSRGVEEVINKNDLQKQLKSKKIRVKLGIDPTAPDLHLGHAVALRKLKQFQDAGHKVILIIGDFTAMIGDPTDRVGARESLTTAQVKKNMREYLDQAGKILNLKKVEIKYNSQWFKKLDFNKLLDLMASFTVQQLTEREDFSKRIKEGKPVGYHELIYPIMQAYDSVMIKADLEIGGRDQRLNILAGRDLMSKSGMKPQNVLTLPLLEGTDGKRKMSKSFGNYIGLNDKPNDMFGKIMSIPDSLISKYFDLLTDLKKPRSKNQRNNKLLLAKTIVTDLHNKKLAQKAEDHFIRVFSNKERPIDITKLKIKNKKIILVDLLVKAGIKSKNEARRLVTQGGVRIDDKVQKEYDVKVQIRKGMILRIGKRKFFEL
ncbi:TPA: tyrosine--tRNA ligase [Patescibacteria group bacterium]|nr:tyrosine--tRNA ligase [Patescibacteria group bacterium]|tara:strand:+ start:1178 stop:2320 length:1143 start_codon:yes stop_codon:yes gene_type:complete